MGRVERANCDKMVAEGVLKVLEVILNDRVLSTNGTVSIGAKQSKVALAKPRFNLAVETREDIRQQHRNIVESLHIGNVIHMQVSYLHSDSSDINLVEDWRIEYISDGEKMAKSGEGRNRDDDADIDIQRVHLRQTYTQLAILVRSLCSFCKLLPAYDIIRDFRKKRETSIRTESVGTTFKLSYTKAALDEKTEPRSGFDINLETKTYRFQPIKALTGELTLVVTYVTDCSLFLNDSTDEITQNESSVYDQYGYVEMEKPRTPPPTQFVVPLPSDYILPEGKPSGDNEQITSPKSGLSRILRSGSYNRRDEEAFEAEFENMVNEDIENHYDHEDVIVENDGVAIATRKKSEDALPRVLRRRSSDSEGFNTNAGEFSRAVSHPRAIPGKGRNFNKDAEEFRAQDVRITTKRGVTQKGLDNSDIYDDNSEVFAFGSNNSSSHVQPKSMPPGRTQYDGRFAYAHISDYGSAQEAANVGHKKAQKSETKIVRRESSDHRDLQVLSTSPSRFRPSSVAVTAAERRSSRFSSSASLRERILKFGSPPMFPSSIGSSRGSSYLESGGAGMKMVTLPSGTLYKSPSSSSLADMLSRSSFTSQQLGSTPTSNSRLLLLMSGRESSNLSGGYQSWNTNAPAGAQNPSSLPFAFIGTAENSTLSFTVQNSVAGSTRRGSSFSSSSSIQQQKKMTGLQSTSVTSSPLFPSGFAEALHNDPPFRGPLHQPHHTLVSSSLPKDQSFIASQKGYGLVFRERTPSTTSTGQDISRISISPFKASSIESSSSLSMKPLPFERRKRSSGLSEMRRRRPMSLTAIPNPPPWEISQEELTRIFSDFVHQHKYKHINDQSFSDEDSGSGTGNENDNNNTDDEDGDLPFAFNVSSSNSYIGDGAESFTQAIDSDLAVFLNKIKRMPVIPSLHIGTVD